MLYPFIEKFIWVDIFVVIVILRMGYIGIKRGFGIEVFKNINVLLCCFVSLHFYTTLGEFIHSKLTPLPVEPASTFSYVLLIFVITIIFRILREGFFVFFKTDTVGRISRIIGLSFGVFRGFLVSGLILYGFLISYNYLELSSKTSALGAKLVRLPIKVYEFTLNGIAAKAFPDQGFNPEIIKALERKPKK